jgi:hypothetical protein
MTRLLALAITLAATTTAVSANGDYPIGYTTRRDPDLVAAMRKAGIDVDNSAFAAMAGVNMQTGSSDYGVSTGIAATLTRTLELQVHLEAGTTQVGGDWQLAFRALYTTGKRFCFLLGTEGMFNDSSDTTIAGGLQLDVGVGLRFKPVRFGFVATLATIDTGGGQQAVSRGYVQLHVPLSRGLGINADWLLTNVDTDDNMGDMQPVFSVGVRKSL